MQGWVKSHTSYLSAGLRPPYNPVLLVAMFWYGSPSWHGGIVENAIRNAIIKFEQEFMGRGPDDVRAFIVRDLLVVRLKGVLTPAERQLAKTSDGVEMVKRLRQQLIAQGRDRLCEQVSEITSAKILGVFTDIDAQLGERVFVFTFDRDIQANTR